MTRQRGIETHIRRIEKRLRNLEVERNRFSRYRPYMFFIGLALTYWLGWTAILAAGLLIGIEAGYYGWLGKQMTRHQLWLDIKKTQLARLNLDWEKIPKPPENVPDEQHPFEFDLDISGSRSLRHLIDMTISYEGSRRLRNWLLETRPDVQDITRRQQIVRELTPFARFRDKLLLTFRLVAKEHLNSQKLLHWLEAQPPPSDLLYTIFPFSAGLAIVNIILFTAHQLGWLPPLWIFSLALYLVLYAITMPSISESFEAVFVLRDELDKFEAIVRYLETFPYGQNVHLKQICAPFCEAGISPSRLLRTVSWLTAAVGWRMNPMLAVFLNILGPWDMFFARLIERYKLKCKERFPKWVDAWAELEALVSLANFAYLHPEYVFPEVFDPPPGPIRIKRRLGTPPWPPSRGEFQVRGIPRICQESETRNSPLEGGQGGVINSAHSQNRLLENHPPSIFQATAMGHPLIPASQRVCNDFSFQTLGEIALFTGSNMAGKSTFLKTLGINVCLAYAGAPVAASDFKTIPFRVFTCIHINDSIADGFSFFYAEVRRLKTLLDAMQADESIPVLFLVDEIFKGTNSRERLIGARAYIQQIAQLPGAGLLATHDIELGQLEEQIAGLHNYHFRDDVREGKMIFDYTLRQGICPTTNALKIMAMEGLPVETDT